MRFHWSHYAVLTGFLVNCNMNEARVLSKVTGTSEAIHYCIFFAIQLHYFIDFSMLSAAKFICCHNSTVQGELQDA